jgi:transcription termination/antitermination protein NusA
MKLGENTALGVKKARQLKHAVGVYLEEEARLRKELDAERAAGGGGEAA